MNMVWILNYPFILSVSLLETLDIGVENYSLFSGNGKIKNLLNNILLPRYLKNKIKNRWMVLFSALMKPQNIRGPTEVWAITITTPCFKAWISKLSTEVRLSFTIKFIYYTHTRFAARWALVCAFRLQNAIRDDEVTDDGLLKPKWLSRHKLRR